MLLTEIILENFMSYEYARIPLKAGLNIICGPNGAGKSSLLLAISVALGQAYTERSRKLSDLIRWGEDTARVTLVFDNRVQKGRRPIPRFPTDYFRVSRYLKKDGTYWFDVNFTTFNKSEVTAILHEFGLNPDNMLIIMHQRMMEEFGITSPIQRLNMVEEAVGLGNYRKNLLAAQNKLMQVLSEEASIQTLFENAEHTLSYWKDQYEKFQKRKEMLQEREYLEREQLCARFTHHETYVNSWKTKIETQEASLAKINKDIMGTQDTISKSSSHLNKLRYDQRQSFYSLIGLEKEKTEYQVTIETGKEMRQMLQGLKSLMSPNNVSSLSDYNAKLDSQIVLCNDKINDVELKIQDLLNQLTILEDNMTTTTNRLIDERVREGLLKFQKANAIKNLDYLKKELDTALIEYKRLQSLLDTTGPLIETHRSPQDISDELKILKYRLSSIGELSEDIERTYLNYLNVVNELKNRIVEVSKNREQVLREVEERQRLWRNIIDSLLNKVNDTYQRFLSNISATGYIRLINSQDIETSGLELTVGFKGAEPAILDAYTQSGGERSTATMAFLLALQQYVKSPFRAVDEFDIHMDPRNREIISDMLYKEIKGNGETQYLTITPSQITTLKGDVHVVTVQNIEGKSEVKVVK